MEQGHQNEYDDYDGNAQLFSFLYISENCQWSFKLMSSYRDLDFTKMSLVLNDISIWIIFEID